MSPWPIRFVDWMLTSIVRAVIRRRDAKAAAGMLESIEQKPWLLRHIPWRDVQELRALTAPETQKGPPRPEPERVS